MKKWFVILCVTVLYAVCVAACGVESVSPDVSVPAEGSSTEIRDHQELTATEITIDTDTAMRISLPEAGLNNLRVVEVSDYKRLDGDAGGYVYLLGDDRYRTYVMMDHYLAVKIDDTVVLKDLMVHEYHFNLSGDIELCDFDGDGDSEILVQQCVDMAGGAGSYLSRVFDYKNGQLVEMFTSEKEGVRDTSFTITLLKDRKFRIDNAVTGYSETFRDEDEEHTDAYYDAYWYDKSGEPRQQELYLDSFCDFFSEDVDGDRVYEIVCRQYASIEWHSNNIGYAKTVLKYNGDTAAFEIVESGFDQEY